MSDTSEEIVEEIVENVVDVQEPEYSEAETKAMESGWRPKEEWNGTEGEWHSAEIFNERGIWIDKLKQNNKRIDDIESGFNQRLDNVNKLHTMQLATQKSELERKRKEAVESGDTDSFDSIQADLDNINQQVQPQAQQQQQSNTDQSAVNEWNSRNSWAFEAGPKSAYANAQYNAYVANGMTVRQALSAVDGDISREFPAQNLNQSNQPANEGGTPPGKKRAPRKLTMADCTAEELNYYKKMPGTWANDADFLRAVQDTRGDK